MEMRSRGLLWQWPGGLLTEMAACILVVVASSPIALRYTGILLLAFGAMMVAPFVVAVFSAERDPALDYLYGSRVTAAAGIASLTIVRLMSGVGSARSALHESCNTAGVFWTRVDPGPQSRNSLHYQSVLYEAIDTLVFSMLVGVGLAGTSLCSEPGGRAERRPPPLVTEQRHGSVSPYVARWTNGFGGPALVVILLAMAFGGVASFTAGGIIGWSTVTDPPRRCSSPSRVWRTWSLHVHDEPGDAGWTRSGLYCADVRRPA